MSLYSSSDSEDGTYAKTRSRQPKRQKLSHRTKREISRAESPFLLFGPLFDALDKCTAIPDPRHEELAEKYILEYLHDRLLKQKQQSEIDDNVCGIFLFLISTWMFLQKNY
jgi:hypothetical protein